VGKGKQRRMVVEPLSLAVHHKQGDDFGNYVDQADTLQEALRLWAQDLIEGAQGLLALAELVEADGQVSSVEAQVHTIEIYGLSVDTKEAARQLEICPTQWFEGGDEDAEGMGYVLGDESGDGIVYGDEELDDEDYGDELDVDPEDLEDEDDEDPFWDDEEDEDE